MTGAKGEGVGLIDTRGTKVWRVGQTVTLSKAITVLLSHLLVFKSL